MERHFNYPAKLEKQKEGGYTVQFIDLPEAITQGENKQEALENAEDCLEEAIANRIIMQLPIPKASAIKKGQYLISLHATLASKAALYISVKNRRLTKSALARKLSCDEKEVRRLLDPYYSSKIPRIEKVLKELGLRLDIAVVSL